MLELVLLVWSLDSCSLQLSFILCPLVPTLRPLVGSLLEQLPPLVRTLTQHYGVVDFLSYLLYEQYFTECVYMYEGFTCMYIYAPRACLVHVEARK